MMVKGDCKKPEREKININSLIRFKSLTSNIKFKFSNYVYVGYIYINFNFKSQLTIYREGFSI